MASDALWGAFLATTGGVVVGVALHYFTRWQQLKDEAAKGTKRLDELRTVVAKLLAHNEAMARRLHNQMDGNQCDDRIYFMFSAWRAMQVEHATTLPANEYTDAALTFEMAAELDGLWREWVRLRSVSTGGQEHERMREAGRKLAKNLRKAVENFDKQHPFAGKGRN